MKITPTVFRELSNKVTIFKKGNVYKHAKRDEDELYMYCIIKADTFRMINLLDGNRWADRAPSIDEWNDVTDRMAVSIS